MITLQRWRGASEYNHALLDFRAHNSHVPRVIPWRFFLLISVFVFFIDNDESQAFERREDGTARPDGDPRPAGMNFVPFIVALAFGQMAVQHGDRVLRFGKTAFETLHRLGRKRNFRDENNRTASPFERGTNCLQINFSLPTAGNAMEQDRARVFRRVKRLRNSLQCK